MKHRLLSVLLIVAVMASAFAGAMAVSVLPAIADSESTGYINDLFDRAKEDCPSAKQQILENIRTLYNTYFDNWLIVIMHDVNTSNWYFAAYEQNTNYSLSFWWYKDSYYNVFRPRVVGDNYMEEFHSCYGFKIYGTTFVELPTATQLGNTYFNGFDVFYNSTWMWNAPTPSDLSKSGRVVYCNRDIKDRNYETFYTANLLPGSYVPPIIDFHWFKFQLGQRWYVTTYDQSLVAAMETGDDTFWVWSFDKYLYSQDDPVTEILTWNDMQYLPAAAQFIEQTVTNISVNGILAYDITDLVLSGDVIQLALSQFYQVIDSPGGMVLGNVMASSEDIISLVLTPDEENESQDNAWNQISDYLENYPSVTISPQDLADQLFGDTAYTGFMGDIRIPKSLGIKFSLFGQDINLCDAYFHYWLYQLGSGLGADENSILNFDLFNACVVAAPQVNRNVYVSNWTSTEDNVIDFDYIGLMDTQDLLDSFDLLLIAPAGSDWLQEVDSSILPFSGSSAAYTNLNQESVTTPRGVEGVYPVYIIVSQKAISKSQLYVFCDGFSKFYDLAVQYCDKRDLWDSSFLEWSMSIFWELETVNGHLFKIENEILGWKLSTQFELLFDKLDKISNNMVEPDLSDVDPWYLPLWNWVNRFAPSVNDFSGSIEVMDDTFDYLPAIPQVTDPPAIPTLPGFE